MTLKYQLKPGYQLYFMTIWFEETAHAIPYGFTELIHSYAVAQTESEAIELIRKKHSEGPDPRRVLADPARSQDLSRYCFPENMTGIQKGAALN